MLSNSEHPITLLLDKLVANRDNSLLVTRGPRPLLLVACEDLIPIQHYIASTDKPWCYAYSYESLWFVPDVDLDCGISIQESKNPNSKFESLFRQELIRGNCWFTDGSKIPEQEFVGFASVNVSAGAIETCRTVKYASIFTAEAMAIYTTLEKFFQNNEHHFNIFKGASPWFKNFTFCRKTIVSINRLRSGHTSLAASLFRFKIVNSDQCSSGEAVEEPNHVFWQCKLYDKAREYLITDLIKAKIFPPYDIESQLSEMNPLFVIPIA
ncbi:Protein of unknown function [Cotesia congregata]|uniref:Uncharacterized protein n=1 Tax=Cotesia congregata TaxID=51543 RepID=A0A8J2ELS3_COTCN|nr:Protein of unknown function [Cotesia congregata]